MIHGIHRSDSILTSRPEETSNDYLATGFSIFIIATTPLSIAMVCLGLLYKKECPLDDRIPRYLLFGGIAGLTIVMLRLSLVISFRNIDSTMELKTHAGLNMARSVMYLFILFIFIWNFYGSYLLFSSSPELEDTTSAQYCKGVVIQFSYVWFTIFDIVSVTAIFLWISSLIAACIHPDFLIIGGIQPPPFLLRKYSDTESICLQESETDNKSRKCYVINEVETPRQSPRRTEIGKFERNKGYYNSSGCGGGETNRKIQKKISNRAPDSRRGSCVSTVIITSPPRPNECEAESKKVFTLTSVDDNNDVTRLRE